MQKTNRQTKKYFLGGAVPKWWRNRTRTKKKKKKSPQKSSQVATVRSSSHTRATHSKWGLSVQVLAALVILMERTGLNAISTL